MVHLLRLFLKEAAWAAPGLKKTAKKWSPGKALTRDDFIRLCQPFLALPPERDGEAIAVLAGSHLKLPPEELPSGDPYSNEYLQGVKRCYRFLSGREDYALVAEIAHLNPHPEHPVFFPYSTGDSAITAQQMQMHAAALENLHLPPQSHVVEFGSGWGNMLIHLALLGHRVSAVEINPGFIQLASIRLAGLGHRATFYQEGMAEFARHAPAKAFDLALFAASFHHCLEHQDLVKQLAAMLKERGRILLVEEPIEPCLTPTLPYAWGPRLDAVSVYYTLKYGWLELGFQFAYLKGLFSQMGFRLERKPAWLIQMDSVFTAERR